MIWFRVSKYHSFRVVRIMGASVSKRGRKIGSAAVIYVAGTGLSRGGGVC